MKTLLWRPALHLTASSMMRYKLQVMGRDVWNHKAHSSILSYGDYFSIREEKRCGSSEERANQPELVLLLRKAAIGRSVNRVDLINVKNKVAAEVDVEKDSFSCVPDLE